MLYSKYGEYGNKWFLLQKHLPGRTQTKIKNYFYGNIRYFLKIIIKFFNKKSTGFVNDIKTETLLDMYEAKNSTPTSIQVSMAMLLSPAPSKNSSIELKNMPVKNLSGRTKRRFTISPSSSWKTIRTNPSPARRRRSGRDLSRSGRVRAWGWCGWSALRVTRG